MVPFHISINSDVTINYFCERRKTQQNNICFLISGVTNEIFGSNNLWKGATRLRIPNCTASSPWISSVLFRPKFVQQNSVAFGRAVSRIDHPNNYIVPNLFNEFDFICLSFPFQEMTVKVFRTLLLECDARVVDNHEQITFKSLQYIYPNKDFVNSFLCCTHTCR